MPTTSTQTNAPWQPAQQYITYGMGQAKKVYQGGQGFNAPNFKTYVPFAPATKQSLAQIKAIANQGNPLAGQSMGAVSGILSGDINNRYNQLYGQNAQDYGALSGQYDTQMGQNTAGYQGQMAKLDQLYSQAGNPYFEQAVQNQADKTAADVQRQFGGLGRIGSAADTGALVDQVGQMRTQALANNWNQNIANQRGILGDESGLYGSYGGMQGNLLGGKSNLYGNYVSNQGNLLSGQTTGQLGAIAAAPGAYQQQYLPAERLGQVGAAREDLNQRALQSQVDKFNTNQQAPLNMLNYYNQQISGSGGTSPGFAQQTVSKPTNWLGLLSGGALTAASLYGAGGGFSPSGFSMNTLFPQNDPYNR